MSAKTALLLTGFLCISFLPGGVADAVAADPLAPDSLVWNEQKVQPADTGSDQLFGFALAIDGDTALVGAFQGDGNSGPDEGRVYVYTESGGTWSETQVLTASDGALTDDFGYSVALDGTTAVVGAIGASIGGADGQGAAYVFTESGGTWSETQKLTADDGAAGDEFGTGVAVSGTTIFAGSPYAGIGGHAEQGAVYVFASSGGAWSQVQKLAAGDGAGGDRFGLSASLDGDTALIGAPFVAVGANAGQGAAYVFARSGGSWAQVQKLTSAEGGPGDEFARSVALDGSTALVGAPFHFVGNVSSQGAAYVFTGGGGSWQEREELLADDGAALDQLGFSVALAGTTALAGAPHAEIGGRLGQGAAYVFTGSGASWAQSAKLTASDGQSFDAFGDAVAASGTTSVAGAPFAVPGNSELLGAAYFYGASCPQGYGETDGTLAPGGRYASPPYLAPAGSENAVLGAPGGFRLYAAYSNGGTPQIFRIPGNEIHRFAPAGSYRWGVKAGDAGGDYLLCILHP